MAQIAHHTWMSGGMSYEIVVTEIAAPVFGFPHGGWLVVAEAKSASLDPQELRTELKSMLLPPHTHPHGAYVAQKMGFDKDDASRVAAKLCEILGREAPHGA